MRAGEKEKWEGGREGGREIARTVTFQGRGESRRGGHKVRGNEVTVFLRY
jgi:hypothetical protein